MINFTLAAESFCHAGAYVPITPADRIVSHLVSLFTPLFAVY